MSEIIRKGRGELRMGTALAFACDLALCGFLFAAPAHACPPWWQNPALGTGNPNQNYVERVGNQNRSTPYYRSDAAVQTGPLPPASCPSHTFTPWWDNTHEHNKHWHCEPVKK